MMAQSLCRIFTSGMADGGVLLADAVCSSLSAAGALGLPLCTAVEDRNRRKLRCTTNLSFVCGLETA